MTYLYETFQGMKTLQEHSLRIKLPHSDTIHIHVIHSNKYAFGITQMVEYSAMRELSYIENIQGKFNSIYVPNCHYSLVIIHYENLLPEEDISGVVSFLCLKASNAASIFGVTTDIGSRS